MAYRSRHEGQVIDDAISVVIAKATVWDEKQDKLSGSKGQLLGFDENGTPVAQEAPDTGVVSFNGRSGDVSPVVGDYTAEMVGADATGSADKALKEAKEYSDKQIAAIPTPDVSGQIGAHNSSVDAHEDIRKTIPVKVSELENDSNYITVGDVDTRFAELIDAAPETMNTLDELATALGDDPNFATTVANQIGTKASSSDLQAHLNDKNNPHGTYVPSKVSEFENDSGYLTDFSETDPTVPAWAKTETKPSYSGSEVNYSNTVTGMNATNVQDAVDELFTSVSNGKATVASAITDKGVSTANDATFATMAANIGKIDTAVTPTITVDSEGLITATCKDKVSTHQLATDGGTVYRPGTQNKSIITAGTYVTDDIFVEGSSNLISSNIKSGVSIFGVPGSYSGTAPTSYTVSRIGNNSYSMTFTGKDSAAMKECFNNGSCYLTIVAVIPPSSYSEYDMMSAYIANSGGWQATGMIYTQGYFTTGGITMNNAPSLSGLQLTVNISNSYNGMRFNGGTIYACTIVKI